MMIITGHITRDYGRTPAGQFYELVTCGKVVVHRTTPDPERFLRWLIQSEVDMETETKQRNTLIELVAPWWHRQFRGSFNTELYLKIIEAKRNNGTLYR